MKICKQHASFSLLDHKDVFFNPIKSGTFWTFFQLGGTSGRSMNERKKMFHGGSFLKLADDDV